MNFTSPVRKSCSDELLKKGLTDVSIKLNDKYIRQLQQEFIIWADKDKSRLASEELSLTEFMLFKVKATSEYITALKYKLSEFNRLYLRSIDREERNQHILELCAALGADKKELRKDKSALRRWFDREALLDRFYFILAAEHQRLTFYLERMGWIYSETMIQQGEPEKVWQRYQLEDTIRPLFVFDGDIRVKAAAFTCLTRSLYSLPNDTREKLVSDSSLQYIYRSALESSQDVFIQREALSLLGSLSTKSLQIALSKRLTEPKGDDDFFVRRHVVSLVGEYQALIPDLKILLFVAAEDPSPAVRQLVAKSLVNSTATFADTLLMKLVLHDNEAAVRGSSILIMPEFLHRDKSFASVKEIIELALKNEKNSFVLKVLLKVSVDCLHSLDESKKKNWITDLLPLIEKLHISSDKIEIRRLSAQTREWFWLNSSVDSKKLYFNLIKVIETLKEGKTSKLASDLKYEDDIQLARVLSLIAQKNLGFTVENRSGKRYLRKGDQFKFRFWRFIHELRNSSTDKRQAHRHTTGRHYSGSLRIPSAVMCELAETKVPGEPLYINSEEGWRPYLPLVDDILSALDQGWSAKPYQIVTSEGITDIFPPGSLWGRLKSQTRLTFGFEEYARKRNWTNSSQGDPRSYMLSLEQLGFKISYRPHEINDENFALEDPYVKRFFAAILPFDINLISEQAKDYFFSVYENTLLHLGVFVIFVSGYFFGRHIILNRLMRKARNSIPLVIGGWGTRGKSGTERLKAALFNALGYAVVSKTSGCEAMFLYAPAYGSLREMFLFRPYDKATIWEQMNVVRLSEKLGCEVFLWECMGLTPSYVHVLQKDWMHDDIATITNTYPDHEDLQGPGGHEIPRVMTNFIPQSSVLITTEEQMLPLLEESANELNTKIINVGWLQAGLLTPDVLERFPYEEHPYNIALVLAMAEELNIDTDFALKEMADRVVADLGVLKTYPQSVIETRRLEFVMGMSANEKYGALGNWTRMEFDQHDLSKDPDVWVTTVINNRADRVSRSRVFASIIACDISVDRHILIGDNLHGLMGYIKESWHDNLSALSLFGNGQEESPEVRLKKLCSKFRVPSSEQEIKGRYLAMLNGMGIEVEEMTLSECWNKPFELNQLLNEMQLPIDINVLVDAVNYDLKLFHEYQEFHKRLISENNQQQLQEEFNSLAWSWLERKLVIVENYHASGNDIINVIVKQTPPGLKARIMGMQNIKGTGLDYVYRWQAWEACYQACSKTLSSEQQIAEQGVKSLAQFREYGPLCSEMIINTLDNVRDRDWAQREEIQAEFVMISSNLTQALKKLNNKTNNQSMTTGWSHKIAEYLEAFLDAGDAVKRRKRANLIYKELQNKRISHDRAAMELQALNKRQKGGWAGEYVTKFKESK